MFLLLVPLPPGSCPSTVAVGNMTGSQEVGNRENVECTDIAGALQC